VSKYLESKCSGSQLWIWVPLRQQDLDKNISIGGGYGHGHFSTEHVHHKVTYHKAIPIRILRDVKKIEQGMGEQNLAFFASDFEKLTYNDPFIMVTAKSMNIIIFGMWDEPGFEG